MTFTELMDVELRRARRLQPAIHSLHEGYSVIKEEVDEFWAEVKGGRDAAGLLAELVQVAAMARRTAEDLQYVDFQEGGK